MMTLSRKTKEAIKTATAMTLAYGGALSMGWDKPMYAGLVVSLMSLETIGQSLNKASMRMFGTLAAAALALTILSFFAQAPWLLMVWLSLVVGYCAYMACGTKQQYFWTVCGFTCVIFTVSGGDDSAQTFHTVMVRLQETGLGILVYSLVSLFLWPVHSEGNLLAAAGKLAATQQQLFQSYLDVMKGEQPAASLQELRTQESQLQARMGQMLEAAESDSHAIAEQKPVWERYRLLTVGFAASLDRWKESLADARSLDLGRMMPHLSAVVTELDGRLAQVARMMGGHKPERSPADMDLSMDKAAVATLSPFNKASLVLFRAHLKQLDTQTRDLFDVVSEIKQFGPPAAVAETGRPPRAPFVLDPDRMTGVVRVMASLWLAYLAVVYVNGMPGGPEFVIITGSFVMALVAMPQVSVWKISVPLAMGVLCAAIVYLLVMPRLSSFLGLGTVLFVVTFGYCYLFADPRKALGKALGLAMLAAVTSIANQQSYNFMTVATMALIFPFCFLLLSVTAHIPFSPRPEKAFLRLLVRFFRSYEYLLSAVQRDPKQPVTRWARRRQAYHAHDVATLPAKLRLWARFINLSELPGTSAEHLQVLQSGLQRLAERMQELLEEQRKPQSPFLRQKLGEDVRVWYRAAEQAVHALCEGAAGEQERLRAGLVDVMHRLETRIAEVINEVPHGQLGPQDGENFCRLLGVYRGLSETIVELAGTADVIDWRVWQEERF